MTPAATMNFWKQFKSKSCSIRLQGSTKEGVLQEIVGNLVTGELLSAGLADPALKALLEREKLGSTGVGMGVAIPHVKLAGIDQVACSLSIHHEGLEWAALDGAPVSIVFLVLRPEAAGDHHDPQRHLEMMQWIAKLGRDGDFRRFAMNVKTKSELIDLLREKSSV